VQKTYLPRFTIICNSLHIQLIYSFGKKLANSESEKHRQTHAVKIRTSVHLEQGDTPLNIWQETVDTNNCAHSFLKWRNYDLKRNYCFT